MKVSTGKFINYIGPYQLADLLKFIGFGQNACNHVGEQLANTKLNNFCEWVHSKRKRKVKVKLDKYDTWCLHNTTSIIIHPLLVQLRDTNNGFGMVSKEDVPEFLHPTYKSDGPDDSWEYSKEAWDWVMNEMIWAFEQDIKDDDGHCFYTDEDGVLQINVPEMEAYRSRMNRGFRLFGKYYQNLWD